MIQIKENQYKVAFFVGNRVINTNNVKKHKESLLEYGKNLIALTYIKGDDDALKGKMIVDAVDGTKIPEESKAQYVVVVDGQHRFLAAKELADENKFELANLVWDEVVIPEGKTVEDVLTEINTVGQKWRGTDHIAGYALRHPEDETVKFAQSLGNNGLSSKTINKYLFFNDRFNWGKVNEEDLKGANVERAKKIWEVVETFPKKVKQSSLIIDYIISSGQWVEVLDKVAAITEEDKKTMDKTSIKENKEKFVALMTA